jgi:hypothetical protein
MVILILEQTLYMRGMKMTPPPMARFAVASMAGWANLLCFLVGVETCAGRNAILVPPVDFISDSPYKTSKAA